MAEPATHSKNTYIELDGSDISSYFNNIAITDQNDEIEVTGFGDSSKRYVSGYPDQAATMTGNLGDDDGTGPIAQLSALKASGETVELVYGPFGNDAGKPQFTYDAIVLNFSPTSAIGAAVTMNVNLRLSNGQLGTFS